MYLSAILSFKFPKSQGNLYSASLFTPQKQVCLSGLSQLADSHVTVLLVGILIAMLSDLSPGLPLNIPPSQNKQNGYTLFYKEFVVHKRQQYKAAICSQANTRLFKYNTSCKTYLNTSLTSHPMLLAKEKFV